MRPAPSPYAFRWFEGEPPGLDRAVRAQLGRWRGMTVTWAIHPTGHAIRFEGGDQVFTEWVATEPPAALLGPSAASPGRGSGPLPAACLAELAIPARGITSGATADGAYRFLAETRPSPSLPMRLLAGKLWCGWEERRGDYVGGLAHDFDPSTPVPLAVSALFWSLTPERVKTVSYHLQPAQRRVLRVASTWTRA